MGNLKAARLALEGLSIGDAFGENFFSAAGVERLVRYVLPDGPWPYTDDTNMALSIYEMLQRHKTVPPDELALSFGEHYDRARGYGSAMHRLLRLFGAGYSWTIADQLFEGLGSYGNGAAMRVAPVGAYYAEDLDEVVEKARISARVTHTHAEGVAGAIAVAIATAYAVRLHGTPAPT